MNLIDLQIDLKIFEKALEELTDASKENNDLFQIEVAVIWELIRQMQLKIDNEKKPEGVK